MVNVVRKKNKMFLSATLIQNMCLMVVREFHKYFFFSSNAQQEYYFICISITPVKLDATGMNVTIILIFFSFSTFNILKLDLVFKLKLFFWQFLIFFFHPWLTFKMNRPKKELCFISKVARMVQLKIFNKL